MFNFIKILFLLKNLIPLYALYQYINEIIIVSSQFSLVNEVRKVQGFFIKLFILLNINMSFILLIISKFKIGFVVIRFYYYLVIFFFKKIEYKIKLC